MPEAGQKLAEDDNEQLQLALERERQLRVRAEESLQRLQAEFQEFTANVCHDLREPLRTVGAYCELLARRDTAGPDSEKLLGFILGGVERIQGLLSAMTEYSATERKSKRMAATEMSAVFFQAAQHAIPDAERRKAVLTAGSLPVVLGDFDALSKMLGHLIENAVKFADRPDVRVHVASLREGAEWVCSVHDNGPGIDPAHHQRIFGLFKRLHGNGYPGNGLGLALCRKVAELHGGRIWVESMPGEGSTFYFSLPAVE